MTKKDNGNGDESDDNSNFIAVAVFAAKILGGADEGDRGKVFEGLGFHEG
jgi:hypothetical protein